jgi:hypothetical protein
MKQLVEPEEDDDWEADYQKYGVLSEEEILAQLPGFFRDPLIAEANHWLADMREVEQIEPDAEPLIPWTWPVPPSPH